MRCSHCPANCMECIANPQFTEIEHTVKVRGNPDQEMTYKREGYLCEQKSFFFCHKEYLLEEEKMLNRFAGAVS